RLVMGHLSVANPDYRHPFLVERPAKAVGLIIISTDRGLAGGLNVNLFKQALYAVREWQGKGAQISLCLIGAKALAFFRRLDLPIQSQVAHLGDQPHLRDLIGTIKVMLDAYRDGQIDRLFLLNNRFINTMRQQAEITPLLPVQKLDAGDLPRLWDYIYEPDAADILDGVLMRYIESQIYQAAVENVACEMAARMVAMKSASDNAGKIIDELQLIYNKARQAAITTELSEIVGGAAAV
ncbi:MAG: ATP synthase F1 subunit gamma, partial [Steroidobacteraceae bacterium]